MKRPALLQPHQTIVLSGSIKASGCSLPYRWLSGPGNCSYLSPVSGNPPALHQAMPFNLCVIAAVGKTMPATQALLAFVQTCCGGKTNLIISHFSYRCTGMCRHQGSSANHRTAILGEAWQADHARGGTDP